MRTQRPAVAARVKLVVFSVLISALALGTTLLVMRTVLMVQVDREADQTITEEVQAFVTFVEGSPHIGNGEPEQFSSEAELMRSFLARQTPESHEALVTVSAGEVMFLDNAPYDAGRRFAESEDTLDAVLTAESSSGVLETAAFGEVRWGRVTTDQDGTFMVLHFTTPAEADVRATMATFTWIGGGSVLLVAGLTWMGSHWIGPLARRGGAPADPAPAAPAPVAATPPEPADGAVSPGASTPDAVSPTPGIVSIRPRRATAAQVLLAVQREAAAAHPDHHFVLASGLEDERDDAAPERTTSVEALGALAQIEAEIDVEALRDGLLALLDLSLSRDAGDAAGHVVVLGGHTVTSPDGTLLRLSIRRDFPAAVHADAPHPSPAETAGRWETAEQIAAAHQGRCWQASGPGSLPDAGMDLTIGDSAGSPDTAALPVPPLSVSG